ncbi:MAG: aminotransferase class IV [Mucilaginibacter sp.]|uniref:aminotransferase class IV n=1 Tax=Mucilaginibacter sp. TaxID=1882438 RepID=UPI003263C813
MSKFTIVNQEFLPAETASVLITDLAIQRGYGIFDFFKTIDGRPVFLEDHLDRFYNSAAAMHLTVDLSREELKTLLLKLIEKNGIADSGIRITLTGGYSPDGYGIAKPNMIITQTEMILSKQISLEGISLITHQYQRQLSYAKTLDYLMAVWLQPVIKEKGADDVLYHNNGIVSECPRANFFIIDQSGHVVTTRENLLKGIIRKHVLEIAGGLNLLQHRDITLDDLKNCKEAFITSSTKNILPVTKIDGRVVGDGYAGPVSKLLSEKLQLKAAQH